MKPILKSQKHVPASVKMGFVLALVIGFLMFFIKDKISLHENISGMLRTDTTIKTPVCSVKGGFYSEPVILKISAGNDLKIFYTLDGNMPDENSKVYEGAIEISANTESANILSTIPTSPRWMPPLGEIRKGTVLRAICIDKNNNKSRELIHTFFVGINNYKVPVVALTLNRDDFFGYKHGIYVLGKNYEDKEDYIRKKIPFDIKWWEYPSNYLKRGSNAGRWVNVEFFDVNQNLEFETSAEARINGNATRGFAQKALRLSFRDDGWNKKAIVCNPFDTLSKYNSIILRNSGNDWNKTMFRDAMMQSLMKTAKVETQSYAPCIVFFNGEYWGIHNLRERFDEDFLSNKYNIPTDSLTILQLEGSLYFGEKSDEKAFKSLLSFVMKNDLSVKTNYEYVAEKIDLISFMDFVIANIYFCNADWPNNNVKFWRYRGKANNVRDGKWRWMLYDTDWGFGYTGKEAYKLDLFEKASTVGSIGVLFKALIKNQSFINVFEKRFEFHLNNTFDTEKVIQKINVFEAALAPYMDEHIRRWRAIDSYDAWKKNVEELRVFAKQRPVVQKAQLKKFIKENN